MAIQDCRQGWSADPTESESNRSRPEFNPIQSILDLVPKSGVSSVFSGGTVIQSRQSHPKRENPK